MRKDEERWAVFWCNLLSPLIYGEVLKGQTNQFLKSLCSKEIHFPDGKFKKPSLSTLRRKYNLYCRNGLSELKRKHRSDAGKKRGSREFLINRAIELKKEQPSRSADTINYILMQEYKEEIPASTLYRHLRNAGATRLKLGYSKLKVRKRWTKAHPNDMWVGDFEEGPYVVYGQKTRHTHLSAFIDVHSRYIVFGRYYYSQDMNVLTDTLVNGWLLHGLPKALYLDNAKVYSSDTLKRSCFINKIKLLHRKVGDPASGGIIERFFKTVQDQFESEVRAGNILTLEELNLSFSSWLCNRYHKRVHSSTHQTPEQMYNREGFMKREIDLCKAYQSFSSSQIRKVNKDFADIRINNCFYRVDKRLRGDKVKVLYNFGINKNTVVIYSLHGKYLCNGTLHNREHGEAVPEFSEQKKTNTVIAQLVSDHKLNLGRTKQILDYQNLSKEKKPCGLPTDWQWQFAAFVQKFADLLGRKGGYSSFTAGELEKLKKTYGISTKLDVEVLQNAFAKVNTSDFGIIIKSLRKQLRKDK